MALLVPLTPADIAEVMRIERLPGYDAFIGYVNRLIRNVDATAPAPVPPSTADQAKGQKPAQQEGGSKARKPKAPEPKKPEPAGIAGFNYNPKPNKEDLL